MRLLVSELEKDADGSNARDIYPWCEYIRQNSPNLEDCIANGNLLDASSHVL
jgi:hypothetical protein